MDSRDQNLSRRRGGPPDGNLAADDEDVKRKKIETL